MGYDSENPRFRSSDSMTSRITSGDTSLRWWGRGESRGVNGGGDGCWRGCGFWLLDWANLLFCGLCRLLGCVGEDFGWRGGFAGGGGGGSSARRSLSSPSYYKKKQQKQPLMAAELDLDLSPQLNQELRSLIVHYVTSGIFTATEHHLRGRQQRFMEGADAVGPLTLDHHHQLPSPHLHATAGMRAAKLGAAALEEGSAAGDDLLELKKKQQQEERKRRRRRRKRREAKMKMKMKKWEEQEAARRTKNGFAAAPVDADDLENDRNNNIGGEAGSLLPRHRNDEEEYKDKDGQGDGEGRSEELDGKNDTGKDEDDDKDNEDDDDDETEDDDDDDDDDDVDEEEEDDLFPERGSHRSSYGSSSVGGHGGDFLVHDFSLKDGKLFRDYSPTAFRELRELEGIDEEDYMEQILTVDNKEGKLSEGASGAFMFFTKVGGYIIKSIKRDEAKVLHDRVNAFISHFRRHPNSLLTRYLGSHSLQIYQQEFHFVVMKDVFHLGELKER